MILFHSKEHKGAMRLPFLTCQNFLEGVMPNINQNDRFIRGKLFLSKFVDEKLSTNIKKTRPHSLLNP